jgi:hypothetical protein
VYFPCNSGSEITIKPNLNENATDMFVSVSVSNLETSPPLTIVSINSNSNSKLYDNNDGVCSYKSTTYFHTVLIFQFVQ